jgi:hypothetical protein
MGVGGERLVTLITQIMQELKDDEQNVIKFSLFPPTYSETGKNLP